MKYKKKLKKKYFAIDSDGDSADDAEDRRKMLEGKTWTTEKALLVKCWFECKLRELSVCERTSDRLVLSLVLRSTNEFR